MIYFPSRSCVLQSGGARSIFLALSFVCRKFWFPPIKTLPISLWVAFLHPILLRLFQVSFLLATSKQSSKGRHLNAAYLLIYVRRLLGLLPCLRGTWDLRADRQARDYISRSKISFLGAKKQNQKNPLCRTSITKCQALIPHCILAF